ncbi:hypothetical protein DFH06DRAFT_1479488 [Mycena polygramma]|nr:hypothetical protein DFH06DRAFT_1479488 [Mycena polygramma]
MATVAAASDAPTILQGLNSKPRDVTQAFFQRRALRVAAAWGSLPLLCGLKVLIRVSAWNLPISCVPSPYQYAVVGRRAVGGAQVMVGAKRTEITESAYSCYFAITGPSSLSPATATVDAVCKPRKDVVVLLFSSYDDQGSANRVTDDLPFIAHSNSAAMGALIRMHDIDIPAAPPVLLSLPTGTHTDIPSDSMTSNDDAEVLQLVADSRLTGYLAAAALSLLTYDHIVCFPQEVTLVWKSRHGNAKILYLWNRYFSLVAIATNMTVMVLEVSSDKVCMSWLRVQCISSTVIVGTVDFVLMCRVWMLYGRLRSFLWLFGCMVIAEVVVMLGVGFIAIERMPKYVHLGSLVTGCYAYNAPRFLAFTAGAPAVVVCNGHALLLHAPALNSITDIGNVRHDSIQVHHHFNTDFSPWHANLEAVFARRGVLVSRGFHCSGCGAVGMGDAQGIAKRGTRHTRPCSIFRGFLASSSQHQGAHGHRSGGRCQRDRL